MNRDLKELTDLAAAGVEPAQVTNPTLRTILSGVRRCANGEFMFKSRHHRDGTHHDHSDYVVDGRHTDEHYPGGHDDHADHYDHTESEHSDRQYSESAYHTDSDNSHSDTSHRNHTDKT